MAWTDNKNWRGSAGDLPGATNCDRQFPLGDFQVGIGQRAMSTSLVNRMEEAILRPARKGKVLPAAAFPGSMASLVAGEPIISSVG